MKTKAIIPCAGFGTRMFMKPNESKEMLYIDGTGNPIIQYSLDLCYKYDLEPLIITRKEKTDLIEYCNKPWIQTLIIEPNGEWPNTILASKHLWNENNIMILPDTRFNPTSVIKDMEMSLKLGNRSVIALHEVSDSSKWCIVDDYKLIEKPDFNTKAMAMGLIGFKDVEGISLFDTISQRNTRFLLEDAGFVYLNDFKDITRTV
jgi:UTP-glucose-1-phosphate uridylyltransferase